MKQETKKEPEVLWFLLALIISSGIMTAIFLISCAAVENTQPVKQDFCNDPEYIKLNRCPTGHDYEGVWQASMVHPAVCNENICEYFSYPKVDWSGCLLNITGYLSFMPAEDKDEWGVLTAELYHTNSCDTSWAEKSFLLNPGSYEVLSNNEEPYILYDSYYYEKTLLAYPKMEGQDWGWFYFRTTEEEPYMKMYMRRTGQFNDCPYTHTPDSEKTYGFCYSGLMCGDVISSLLASCITSDDCLYVLGNHDYEYGTWWSMINLECKRLVLPQ